MNDVQGNAPIPNAPYSVATGTGATDPLITVFSTKDPSQYDNNYPIKKRWINTDKLTEWILVGFSNATGQTLAIWEKLSEGGVIPIETVNVDVSTAPGVNPVSPESSGVIYFQTNHSGASHTPFATGTNPYGYRTSTKQLNEYGVELQLAGSNPAVSTPNNFGIAQFDSDQFTVTDGYVQISGSGPVMETITGDDLMAVSPVSDNINLTGNTVAAGTHAKPVFTHTTGNPNEIIDVQVSSAQASSDINNAGLSSFSNSQFTVDANGFVNLKGGSTGAILGVHPDAHTAPGTDPVLPDSSGNIKIEGGATFATGTQADPIRTNSLAANTMDLEIQLAGSNAGSSTPNNFGVAQFDANQFTVTDGFVQLSGATTDAVLSLTIPGPSDILPDPSTGEITYTSTGGTVNITSNTAHTINFDVTGGGAPIETLSDDNNNKVTPTSNNIQLVGHVVEQGATKFSTVDWGGSDNHLLNINPMSPARWIVDPLGFNGTHTTIASAITSATSGDTILLLPGTYTEDITLKAGVNITGQGGDQYENTIIKGKVTIDYTGKVSLANIQFNDNSSNNFFLNSTTSPILQLWNCYIRNSSASNVWDLTTSGLGQIFLNLSTMNISGTGKYFNLSKFTVNIYDSIVKGGLDTASTLAANSNITCLNSSFSGVGFITSGAGSSFNANNCTLLFTGGVTQGGTSPNSTYNNCFIYLGINAFSTSTGCTSAFYNCEITSTNANPLTGAGTVLYSGIVWTSSGKTINATTITPAYLNAGILQLGGGSVQVLAGSGSPNTVVTAPQGSLYLRTDGSSSSTRAYINTNGSTAWTNITTAT